MMLSEKSWKCRPVMVFVSVLVALVVSLSLVSLHGCGGGGGGPSPAPKLSGTVTAPQGTPIAQAPSLLQRLASLLISVAEAQALQGQAVANADVKAFIWPNVPPTATTPVATAKTGDDGRYTLQLPADAVGKDIVVIAEKSVTGGTLRLSTIAADVPKEGKTGVNLDAATTLATEQIVSVSKEIQDLFPSTISVIISEVRKIVDRLEQLNLVAGAENSPIPSEFGAGLREVYPAQEVAQKVGENQGSLPAPTDNNVAIAKSIVQMLRDFGSTLVGIGDNEVVTIQKAVEEQQQVIGGEVKVAQDFAERMDFTLRTLEALGGEPPGAYEEVSLKHLVRVGDTDNKTWKVTSKVSETQGMVLTISSSKPMEFFEFSPEGVYTLQVRKEGDSSVQYDGQLQFTNDSQGIPTSVALNITIKDKELTNPISFNGTLSGVVAPGSTPEKPKYSKATFSGTLSSQFGTAQVGKLEVEGVETEEGDFNPQKITLTNLQVTTQTSKPAKLTLNGTFEFAPTPQQWKEEWGDTMPKSGSVSATLEASGVTLSLSNAQISDFVFVSEGEDVNCLPKKLVGQLNYSSPSLTFQGSINAFFEGLGSDTPSEQVKFTLSLSGDWKPNVGSPLSVSINTNSTSQKIHMDVTLKQGDQQLKGAFDGVWTGGDEPQIASAELNLTHSPSNFKVKVSQKSGQPVSGQILTAQGTKVADIGEAKNLGLPDLGSTLIVKYTDGTFETLESILPSRSRVTRR